MMTGRTLYEKVFANHEVRGVRGPEGAPSVLGIDLHLIHEVTSPQAFSELARRGLRVRRPDRTLATMDHSTPTEPAPVPTQGEPSNPLQVLNRWVQDPEAAAQLRSLERSCREQDIPLFPLGDPRQGIVHVIGPELGLTQPGMTIVCGDSHTSTHGAFGALAFGIGTSEVGHVLATQCLLQRRARTFEVRLEGQLQPGVTAKDMILAVISELGVEGGTGHVLEYTGSAVRALSMEQRMTLCNMSIEAGARAGMVAPDDTTYEYLAGRPYAPQGEEWERALAHWRQLPTDDEARYDRRISLEVSDLEPRITFGTDPGLSVSVRGHVPDPERCSDSAQRGRLERSLRYMGFRPGQPMLGQAVDVVFVGSCTNSRISDLRQAASVLQRQRVAEGVRLLVVPGSQQVKRQAEQEGLDRVFREAGAEWREAGCSMCLGMNGDQVSPGRLAVSTSNRNFEGRQGPGSRTLLASPLTAAAAAVRGAVADPRELIP